MIELNEVLAIERNFAVEYLQKRISADMADRADAFASFENVPDEKRENIYSINGDTASIDIRGVLTQSGPDWLDRFLGIEGTAYPDILDAIEEISARDEVKTVRLEMDTPGGEANGVDSVYQAVQALAGEKKVYAINHGLVASAGYYIASAASEIIGVNPAVETGSIGVVIVTLDRSNSPVVQITSRNAPNKNPNVGTKDGKAVLQDRVDALERVFIQRVAEGRGVDAETVKEKFGRGGLLIAQDPDPTKPDATRVGMIDRVIYSAVDQKSQRESIEMKAEEVIEDDEIDHIEENQQTEGEIMADQKKADPDHAVEIEQLKNEKDQLEARIKAARPFLTADYPAKIRELAVKVLEGESKPEALEGAVVALDAMREENKANAAVEDTNNHPDTAAVNAREIASEDGTISNAIDFDAAVKEMRAKLGYEVKR